MSGARHELWLTTPTGDRQQILTQFGRLTYARRALGPGAFTLQLPTTVDADAFQPDSRLEIWRAPGPAEKPELDTDTIWLVRTITQRRTPDGTAELVIGGTSAVGILERRIAAYPEGDPRASVISEADRDMARIIRENYADLATDTDRDASEWLDVHEPATSTAPIVRKRYAWRTVLDALVEISDASAELGTRVWFDVVHHTQTQLGFRTYIGLRGVDHGSDSSDPVVFSEAFGNLEDATLTDDYTDEVTVVYAGGQGEGADRVVIEVADTARSSRSPFGRIERFVDARSLADTADVTDDGRAALSAGEPRRRLTGRLVDGPRARYGVHWRFGDRVVVVAHGAERNVTVDVINVTVDQDGEQVVGMFAE